MENFNLGKIGIMFAVFLFSTACHEAAHATMANWWGDTSGKESGQMSLNPLPHIMREPFGMLVLPLLMLFQSGGNMLMGWASTPVDTGRMRDAKWGNFWTSAAGPLTNLLLAIVFLLLLKLARTDAALGALGGTSEAVGFLLYTGVWLNILLMVFNFLPVPPLDGGHMLESLLPPSLAQTFAQLRPFGMIIVLAIGLSGLLGKLVNPLIDIALSIL